MKHQSFLRCLLWMTGVAVCTACTDDERLLLDVKPAFDVTLDGKSILDTPTPQPVEFGRSLRFDLLCTDVAYLEALSPEGWNCALIVSDNYLTVAAPSYDNLSAEPSGSVVFKVYDAAGRAQQYTLPVEAIESEMTVSVGGEIAEQQIFGLGKSRTYTYAMSENAERLSLSLPDGWQSQIDDKTFTVIAPAPDATDFAEEGTVAAAAVSPRGTKGAPVCIDVAISRAVPSLHFEADTYSLHFGQTIDIPFTATEVARATVETVPDGWDVAVDLDASKLVVTAPAKGTGTTGGTLDLRLVSAAELEDEAAVTVRLYGIGSLDEFKAFRDLLAAGGDPAPYLIDGEATLTTDIEVTTADLIYAEGSASNNDPTKQALTLVKAFGGYGFNGDGHTMRLSVDIDCKKFALFYKIGTVSSTSAEKDDPHTRIHDLRLTGSIRSTYTTTAKDQGMLLAALACYNNGAEVCNLTSDVAIVHERSDFGSESDTKLKQGIIAGITATDQFGSPSYGNVTVTGAISTRGGVQNIGGITGTLASNNDYGTFTYTACEHTGAITVTQFSGRHSDGYIGGLIGNSQKQQPRLTDCTNRGDLTIDLQGGAGSIQSCGGIIGSGYGTLTRCDNHGNITADEAALKADGKTIVNRRYGGLIGGQGNVSTKDQTEARHFLAELTDCTNYGNIKVSSSMVGGLIGFTEKNWQETGILRNCVNEGTVESLAPVLDMGGLIGRSSGASLYGCTNRGTIKGASSRCAAGLIGTIGWSDATRTYDIDGCTSAGDILLAGNNPEKTTTTVQVSGLMNTYFTTPVAYRITGCTVDCRIVADNADINLFFGSYNGGKTDSYTTDAATQANSQLRP